MNTLLAYFETSDQLRIAIESLTEAGVNKSSLTVLNSADVDDLPDVIDTDPEASAGMGAAIGGSIGATLGLIGTGVLATIPGIGPILAAGAMTTLTGGFAGSYLGAIYSLRADSQSELTFKDALGQGGYLLIVPTNDLPDVERTRSVLEETGKYVQSQEIDTSEID